MSNMQKLSHPLMRTQTRQRRNLSMKSIVILTGKTLHEIDLNETYSLTEGTFIPER